MAITHTTPAGGNVFADLGFPADEAANLKLRSSLMIEMERIIEARALAKSAAAMLFGTTEARIDDLRHGNIDAFTIDDLVAMLSHAGLRVELNVRAA